MLEELGNALSAPRRWLWGMLPGLHDDAGNALSGSQVATNAFGMDPESPWTKALGFGLEVAGDPMNLAVPMLGRGVSALAGLKYAAPAAEAAGEATNAFNPAMKGLRDTFGMVKRLQPLPAELAEEARTMTDVPRRMAAYLGETPMVGETTGPMSRSAAGFMADNVPDIMSGRIGGTFAGIENNAKGVTGIGLSTNPITNRHEVVHGLINAAADTGNTAGLPLSMKVPANIYRYGGWKGVPGATGRMFDEAAAHAAEGRGFLNQLGRYGDFFMDPHPSYLDAEAQLSPLVAAMHRNFRHVAPATLAGGAYLGAQPFFGGE